MKHLFILLALIVLWTLLRSPNLSGEFGYKMDAASAGIVWFIKESWDNDPASRYFCPVDHRNQWHELETGTIQTYMHVPPLGLTLLGIWTQFFPSSEISIRLFSIFTSLIFLFFIWKFLKTWSDHKVAIITIALMAFCTQSVHYSRNADPILSNTYFLPLLAWVYLIQLRHSSWKSQLLWCSIAMIAMLSYWNSYAVFGLLCLHQLIYDDQHRLRTIFYGFGLPILAIAISLSYFSLAAGGWDILSQDFKDSVSWRTKGANFSLIDYFLLEAKRIPRNYSAIICLLFLIYPFLRLKDHFSIQKKERHLLWFLLVGALAFPLFVKNTSRIHEYFNYWMILPLFAGASLALIKLWTISPLSKAILSLSLILFLAQSLYVSHNRLIRYHRDYLLARHMGKTFSTHYSGDILLTDSNDNIHVLQYYSDADVLLRTIDLEQVQKAYRLYQQSGRKEGITFITSHPEDMYQHIDELHDYPMHKLTHEWQLNSDRNAPIFQWLHQHFEFEKKGPFSIFRYKNES